MTAPELADLIPFPEFARECEQSKTATVPQLRWWVRYRHDNGLTASGAVIEKRPSPRSRKPLLFVNRPRFVAWLSTPDSRAA